MSGPMPNNILLIRTDNVGDLIVSLPTCTYLKQIYPGVRITLLHRDYVKDIVDICDSIDDFISIEESELMNNDANFIKIIKDKKIDACINLVGHISKEDLLVQRISTIVKEKIAKNLKFYIERKRSFKEKLILNRIKNLFRKHKIFSYLYTNSAKYLAIHEIYRNIFVLKELGVKDLPKKEVLPSLYKLNTKSITLDNDLQKVIVHGKINLIMHPKSNGHCIEWPLNNYAKLIDKLDNKTYRIILTGSVKERIFIDELITKITKHDDVINLAGKTTLKELAELINLSDGILSAATGPMHIAAALGVHTLGIFPRSSGSDHIRIWFPVGYDTHIIQNKNLDKITPQLVANTIENRFSNKRT